MNETFGFYFKIMSNFIYGQKEFRIILTVTAQTTTWKSGVLKTIYMLKNGRQRGI